VKDALPGEVVKQEFVMRVDLQELDEDHQSETQNLRTWSEKNPYKVGRLDTTATILDFQADCFFTCGCSRKQT
jgi:hypothetical protein